MSSNGSNSSSPSVKAGPPYAKSKCRVNKDDLYMILALWMEQIAETPKDVSQKVGAVLVLPNDIVWAADCSREGVHAVVRLLMKHYDKAEGSKMFMSRKPCPMCAKLLVQLKVKRVLFLPFEPEYYRSPEETNQSNVGASGNGISQSNVGASGNGISQSNVGASGNGISQSNVGASGNGISQSNVGASANGISQSSEGASGNGKNQSSEDENKRKRKEVDNLFTASPIAQTRFVLKVEESVLKDANKKALQSVFDDEKQKTSQSVLDDETQEELKLKLAQQIKKEKDNLDAELGFKKYPKWTAKSIKKYLPWAEYDKQMEEQVQTYFNSALE